MNRTLPIIVGVVLIALVGGLVYIQNNDTAPAPVTNTSGGTATTGSDTYTMAEVQTHNGASSCWTVIDGAVYDLTQWIPQHPGGEAAIESICGIDGSTAFHGQHDHAQEQADILATFKIGTLSQ
jgi:cytochrome b involved in lipid metabolism